MRPPSYDGRGLVNLVAELERRLRGEAPSPPLGPELATLIPGSDRIVFVLFDGLGDHQLSHPAAAPLAAARMARLDAPFSSQTTVATATLASGLPPARHGLIAYLLHDPALGGVLNTIWWLRTDGEPVESAPEAFLPSPNLAERLVAAGCGVSIVLPAGFVGSPLERLLFRGATPFGWDDPTEIVPLALDAAARDRGITVVYLPDVDAAAHYHGQASDEYAAALGRAAALWEELAVRLPETVTLVGTADHGHVDIPDECRLTLVPPDGLTLYGDSRAVYVHGDPGLGEELVDGLPATWHPRDETDGWWGPGPFHPRFEARRPDGVILADPGYAFSFPGNDAWTVGQHGGLTEEELAIPLLVR